jgi:16S rRNA (guanine966-N2)-methyltransferase
MRVIAGLFKGRLLQRPPQAITRPTSDRARESIFNILSHLEDFHFSGSVILDLFAGSGAMGLEALSRGAAHAIFVELNSVARQVIAQNIQTLKLSDQVNVLVVDVLNLPMAQACADLIFLDPPYFQGLETPALAQLGEKGWCKPGTIVVLETSKKTQFDLDNAQFTLLTRRTFSNTAVSIFKVIA